MEGNQKPQKPDESLFAGCAQPFPAPISIEGGTAGLPLRLPLRSTPEGHVEPREFNYPVGT